MTIQAFIMMNLFVLVIIQQFDKYYLADGNILDQFKENFEQFKENWTYFTREYACQKIKDVKIYSFFSTLKKPIGMMGDTEDEIVKNIVKMDLDTDAEGFVYFNELLYKAMQREYGDHHIKNKLLAF